MHMREHKSPKKGRSPGLLGILERLSVKSAKIHLAEWLEGPEVSDGQTYRTNRQKFGSRDEMKRSWWH